jgi:hypothetical protein
MLSGDDPGSFSLFPNPGDQVINLHFTETPVLGDIRLILQNSVGKTVKTMVLSPVGAEPHEIPTADLADGVYFMTVHSGNTSKTKQFIIQHAE